MGSAVRLPLVTAELHRYLQPLAEPMWATQTGRYSINELCQSRPNGYVNSPPV